MFQTVEQTEFAKKGKDFTEELTKSAGKAAESITKQGQQFGQSAAFKNISEVGKNGPLSLFRVFLLLVTNGCHEFWFIIQN